MRRIVLGMVLAAGALYGVEESPYEQACEAYHDREFDKAIKLFDQLIAEADHADKGRLMVKLALCHYRNQNDVKAFGTYLAALDAGPYEAPERDGEEDRLCKEALAAYLDPERTNAREVAAELRHTYAHTCDMHPEYRRLNFYLASAYANLGMFDEFFREVLS